MNSDGSPAVTERFSVEMLPAQQGDALWIEYGDSTKPRRILIDGGTPPTAARLRARIAALAPEDRRFEAIVVTHIDTDHIGGMLKLLADRELGITAGDFLFNAWPQLPGSDRDERLGPIDGEILQRIIEHTGFPWNAQLGGLAVCAPADPETPLPTWTLAGGLTLTVLSPGVAQLSKLKDEWRAVLADAGLAGANLDAGLARAMAHKGIDASDVLGDTAVDVDGAARSAFHSDQAVANSTSIGLLVEFAGRRALFTGDAWAPVLGSGIERLLAQRGEQRLSLDLFKVAHHGSKNNTSLELLGLVDCARYAISTNGAIFGHPDVEAIARILARSDRDTRPTELYFNYRSERNKAWGDPALQAANNFEALYPEGPDEEGLKVEI